MNPTDSAARTRPGLSLKRQLLLWLLLPQLVLWLVGGWLAYQTALSYAEKAIDQSLTQTVRSLARQVKPIGSGLLVDFPRAAQDIIEQDPKDRVSYMVSSPPGQFVLGNAQLPAPPAALSERGIPTDQALVYGAQIEGKPVRVALLEVDYGEPGSPQRLRVQMARSLAAQQAIARELVTDILVPLVLLGGVLGLLVWAGISRGLQPLRRLAGQISARQDLRLSAMAPIEMAQAPLEVHALAGALNQLLATVQRSLTQEKRFLSDAAHQLRTPLAGLISQAELAVQEASEAPAGLRERLLKVQAGAERSAHLVHQLLALARHEAEVVLQPLDLAALARSVAREWTPRALAAGVDLGYEGPEQLQARGEQLLLREALSNLLDNALRYAGRGASVTVTLHTTGEPAQAVLAVRDNGPGLASEDLGHVFERFWRASDLPGGCGLGLAIVQEIALRHGGQASAEAEAPQGLRVALVLPLPQPTDATV